LAMVLNPLILLWLQALDWGFSPLRKPDRITETAAAVAKARSKKPAIEGPGRC
jgi:hypothetical protein